jgi:hypothetical protein
LLRGRTRWRLAFAGAGIAALLAPASFGDAVAMDPTCFGAAARDPQHPCEDRTLERTVRPTPARARTLPNSPCRPLRDSQPPVCSFGAAAGPVVALVGDSHAGHWRGALEIVAQSKGWRGLSLTHSSCPLQKALRDLREPRRTHCRRWKRDVFAWFAAHPEVETVFVAGLTGGSGVVARPGRSRFETSVRGYADAWRALPASVRTIVVIRDTPKMTGDTDTCVQRAVAAGRSPSSACAISLGRALDRDPAMVAAARLATPRVRTVDLTPFFCGSECYPVVGGALVLRDNTHMTGTYSTTLGPYLLRAVDAVMAR